jgi:hypothetical protein
VELLVVGDKGSGGDVLRVELLSLSSPGSFFVPTSILLDSAWVLLDTVTVVLWDLARAVLVALIFKSARVLLSVLLGHDGDDLGDSRAVSAFHLHNGSSDLSLVLPGGDDGADVGDLSISSN